MGQTVVQHGVYYDQPYCKVAPNHDRPRLPVTHWSAHDLRRTTRTLLATPGCPNEIAEAVLGHVQPGIIGIYNRHTYDRERREWLTKLSHRLEEIEEPVVFLGWSPHQMNLDIKMQYLTGGDNVFGPDYGAAKVYTVLSTSFSGTCPNASKLLAQLRFTPDMESEIMAQIMAKKDATDSAKAYLRSRHDFLSSWLSGVTTIDGKEALPAVKRSLGL